MTNYLKAAAAVGALAFAATEASANFINGDVLLQKVGNAGTVTQGGGNTTFTPNNPFVATGASGDYLGAAGLATLAPITFTTATGALVSGGSPTWKFDSGGIHYDFTLVNLTGANYTVTPGNGGAPATAAISMSGQGIATATGFDPTAASWSLSGSGSTVFLTITTETTSASGTQPPPSTPDGGTTAALLGLGFVGAAIARKKLS